MSASAPRRPHRLFDLAPHVVSCISVAAGTLVLVGWFFDVATLKRGLPGWTLIKANTAAAMILCGVALWETRASGHRSLQQGIGQVCAGIVLLLGLFTLAEYVSGLDFGIDQLLIREVTSLPGDIPGRMAVNTALALAALGATLLLVAPGKTRFITGIHILLLVPLVAAGSALIGYGYDIEQILREKLDYTPMALPTAVVVILLALGVASARPEYPFRRFMASESAAGVMVRRLLPAVIVFTLAIGLLIERGHRAGHFGAVFALALSSAASITGLCLLVLWSARTFDRADSRRKQAEDELRESSERIRDLYNNVPNGYLSADANGIVTEMNDTLLHWLQYSREEIIGKPLGKFLTAEGVKAAETATKILQERGWTRDDAYDLVRKDGSVFPVLASSTPVMGPDGKLLMSRCSVFDNTERKRAEEQLRAASLYARSLLDASLDPLVTISAEGKITDVNEATIKVTGVRREELIGTDFSNYFTEPDKARAGYREVFAKGFVKDYPLALRHASGSMIEVLYNASVYCDANGEVAGVFAAARDVTELKRTESALKERVKELQAFFHLSELAARKDFPLESLCQDLVNVLPQSTQYPEIACARIIMREREFRTANFAVSAWMLAAPISALGEVVGKVEVGYLEQKPEEDDGPFLKEERQLIDAIAERVGQFTELKHAEGALRASEQLFRALANATSEGMLIHEQGRIVEANRQMEEVLGRPRAEIVGAAVLDFVAPAWRDMASRRVQTPEDTRGELAFVRPDGAEVFVSSLAHSCVYLGRPMRISVYRDITLEKRAEEELRNVGAYNRSLIEVSLDPLVTISPDGKITDVNDATVQATGMPRSLLLGSDFANYFTEPDKARAGYQEVFAKGFVTDYPLCLRHVSGRTKDVLYNASVYRNAKGEVAGVFAAARDISERKRAEDELRHYREHLEELVRERTSKLNAVNKDLEEFIYSMAHDLGIPLRAVNGFAHILLTEYRDKLDDEGRRYLNVVQDNTRRMGRLMDDILAFSRLRGAEMSVSEINMEELVHEGLDELRPTFAGRELNVEIKPLRSTRGDRTMLRQVWVNLLSNAIKFTREKSAARIEVGCVVEEIELVYYVKDNGAGFDMQYADKLFGVFQRLHGVEEFEGQGIGLAMVKRIVTRHGGRVWAEGKLNEGATIYFALPAKGQEHG